MTTYYKHYRLVAEDFRQAAPNVTATQGLHLAEQGERDLRARLGGGQHVRVVLASPERATFEEVSHGGRLRRSVCAWLPDSPWMHRWLHAPHVAAEMTAEEVEPDPVCSIYADQGSVYLTGATITRLWVSPWVAPLAAQLEAELGVPVEVLGGEDVPAPVVEAAPPLVIPGLLTPEQCRFYREALDEAHPPVGVDELLSDLDAIKFAAPPELLDLAQMLLSSAADRFGVPVTGVDAMLMRYVTGLRFDEHTDAYEGSAKSLDRTLSLSLLLSEPGRDFTGGQFVVNGEPLEMHEGDVVVFTSRTLHGVTGVRSGRRLVLVSFGEVIR